MTAPSDQVWVAIISTVGAVIVAYITYKQVRKQRGRRDDSENESPTTEYARKRTEKEAVGTEALASIATESLVFLQRMLEQSQKNEKELRDTVQELERTNQQKDSLIERLRAQLQDQINLNEETARELMRLRRRLNERQGE